MLELFRSITSLFWMLWGLLFMYFVFCVYETVEIQRSMKKMREEDAKKGVVVNGLWIERRK